MNTTGTGFALRSVVAAATALLGAQALAATQTLNASYANASTEVTAPLLEVSQFDPSLGVLNAVTLSFAGSMTASSSVSNTSQALRLTNVPVTVGGGFHAALSLGDPATLPAGFDLIAPSTTLGTRIFVTVGPGANTATGPFTLAADPAGLSFHFTSAGDLGAFTGTGSIGYRFSTQSFASRPGSFTTIVLQSASSSSATMTVQYDFTPPASPVPEPGGWALLLAGLGAGGFVLRQRPRATGLSRR